MVEKFTDKDIKPPKELLKKEEELHPERLESTWRERLLSWFSRLFIKAKEESEQKDKKVCVDSEVRKEYIKEKIFPRK